MIPRLRPPYTLADLARSVSRSDSNSVERFEQEFAAKFEYEHGVFFPYGRTALQALLTALGWKRRTVLIPAYTCVVVPHAVVASGNIPVFMDSDTEHFNAPAAALEQALSGGVDMVVPTPVFGYPVDMQGYAESLAGCGVSPFVLYDAAHGFLVEDDCGLQCFRADAALFGLGPGKYMSSVSGGILLVHDAFLAKEVRRVRDVLCVRQMGAALLGSLAYAAGLVAAFSGPLAGLVHRLESGTTLLHSQTEQFYGKSGPGIPADCYRAPFAYQAELGRAGLSRLAEMRKKRRRISVWYHDKLTTGGVRVFSYKYEPTWSHFPLWVRDRERVFAAMLQKGVQCGRLIDYSCPQLPGYEAHAGLFPNSRRFGEGMINLPNYPQMSDALRSRVLEAVLRTRDEMPEEFLS